MSKKYFFFQGCNFKDDDKDEDDEMGRRKNKNKHKHPPHKNETKPRFSQPDLDDDDTDAFGFAAGIESGSRGTSSGSEYGSWKGNNYSSSFSSSNEKKQTAQNVNNVISTSRGFFEVHHSDAWGSVLIPVEDPKAMAATAEDIENIKLIENFPKIPAKLWSRWIKLCLYQCYESSDSERKPEAYRQWCSEKRDFDFYTYKNGQKIHIENPAEVTGPNAKYTLEPHHNYHNYNNKQLEVSVLLCRKADDLTQWRILVPKQQVTHASVSAETKLSIDIETGEVCDVFPPPGWLHAGSSHSHNTMSAFFSGTDDHSELTVPGLHIVVGSIKREAETYDALASIVLRQCRKKVDINAVVDAEHIDEVTFHSNVLECISNKSYTGTSTSSSSSSSSSSDSDGYDTSGSGRWPMSERVRDKDENEERPSPSLVLKVEDAPGVGPDSGPAAWWARFKAKLLSSYKPYNANRHMPKGPPVCPPSDVATRPCSQTSKEDDFLCGYGVI